MIHVFTNIEIIVGHDNTLSSDIVFAMTTTDHLYKMEASRILAEKNLTKWDMIQHAMFDYRRALMFMTYHDIYVYCYHVIMGHCFASIVS